MLQWPHMILNRAKRVRWGSLAVILHVALCVGRDRRQSVSYTAESALSWLAFFGISTHFKVAVGADLINVINDVKNASLLTKLVNGRKAIGQHWCREEPVSYLKNWNAGS